MNTKCIGKRTVRFQTPPRILSTGTIVGDVEGEGPLGSYFDIILKDDMWGEKSYEKCECKMFEQSVRTALEKIGMDTEKLDIVLGGDLLNQLITANFAARQLGRPFLGLYGACSTMAEGLLVGSMLIDGGFANYVSATASSHFSTAERQFRMPLELGGQTPPTSQRTVTGAGTVIICDGQNAADKNNSLSIFENIVVVGGTIGKVIDYGITDANNMGGAMAPAAADTLLTYLEESGETIEDFDYIITGDLGSFGAKMFKELCHDSGVELGDKHIDCGNIMFLPQQNTKCGGSGCGCAATVFGGYLLKRMEAGDFKRVLFMATGALMSPVSSMQGESIPAIAHAVVVERR